ncbi:hypothetical protein VCSRO48_0890 [Vibrio cholerae]|uniref:hypothetical protein n=1 Tax=Vibrio cholerae TaxID=666 RepID=UPI0004E33EA0|nr:hypothetical protein [Vibrio cholerae]KFE12851.1 hypothetical protein DN37_1576 [Vibrio cholerae]GIB70322.1 hypothetical protein VCSRO48_0890 [Vibrio cholerae]
MAKLTKAETQGIRLIADVFVLDDLIKNVFEKDEAFKGHVDGLKKHINKACPKLELARAELQKQIQNSRRVWLAELSRKEGE